MSINLSREINSCFSKIELKANAVSDKLKEKVSSVALPIFIIMLSSAFMGIGIGIFLRCLPLIASSAALILSMLTVQFLFYRCVPEAPAKQPFNMLSSLSQELLYEVLDRLPPPSIGALAKTCKELQSTTTSYLDTYWNRFIISKHPSFDLMNYGLQKQIGIVLYKKAAPLIEYINEPIDTKNPLLSDQLQSIRLPIIMGLTIEGRPIVCIKISVDFVEKDGSRVFSTNSLFKGVLEVNNQWIITEVCFKRNLTDSRLTTEELKDKLTAFFEKGLSFVRDNPMGYIQSLTRRVALQN